MEPGSFGEVWSASSLDRHETLLRWLGESAPAALEQLWRAADQTRAQFVGEEVDIWGTIKVSSHCDDECGFCGLRAARTSMPRYRLSADEVVAAAGVAKETGCRQVVLQSGRDSGLAADWVGDLVRRIGEETGLEVALSLGERTQGEMAAWRRAGASSYYLRFMTANTTLFRFLHARECEDPRRRLPLLAALKQLGYRVGSGILVGFPGQSQASLVADLELMGHLDLDAALITPYVWPAEVSSLLASAQDSDPNSAVATLKVMALARLVCPGADIPSTSSLATAFGGPEAAVKALGCGANAIVVDVTPPQQRDEYRCYPARRTLDTGAYLAGLGGVRALVEERHRRAVVAQQAAAPDGEAAAPVEQAACIGICMGSSCFSRGNNRTVAVLKEYIAAGHLEHVAFLEGHLCQGRCKEGPNVTLDGQLHPRADAAAVVAALRQRLSVRE